ncbi:MAG TPA: EAL domain-containing protein [Candidatus Krumholzibacteria bacterium]|nr:EAL domain-containing protein [Candidatus Krumholzibacteria bacterium]HPD70855.1 EAL domain-containing protein [Candidatus Krumholzibacteria bacterium]
MDPRLRREEQNEGTDLVSTVVEQIPLGVLALDRDGRVLLANGELGRLLGRPAAELRGQPLPGLADAERASLHGLLAQLEHGDQTAWRQFELALPERGIVPFSCRGATFRSPAGDVRGLVGFLLPADLSDGALQAELRRRNALIEAILENLPIGLAINSLDMSSVGFVNSRFQEIYGPWTQPGAGDLAGFLDRLCPDPDQRREFQRRLVRDLGEGGLKRMQWDDIRVRGRDGALRIINAVNTPLPEQGLMISTVHDVTDRRLAEDALRESERRYQIMAESSPVGIFRCDRNSRCRYVNRRWREITGLTTAQAADEGWLSALHPDDQETVARNWQQSVTEGQIFRSECRFRRPRGLTTWVFVQAEPSFDDHQQLSGYVGSVTDISERKRTEEEVRRIAYYDALTKLPNRAFFLEQLRRTLASAKRNARRSALLFCDLDNFKDVNDSLGHDKGDLLLQGIAERLSACIRQGDTLSRLGGDEFVLLLPVVTADRDAVMVARKIQEQLAQPFDLDGHEVYTSPSIGIAFYPDDGDTVSTLLKHADMAMYSAKTRGRNRYQFFSEDMHRRASERMKLEAGLRQALERREFRLVYQPQYELATGRLVGVEALLRWRHPEQGTVLPQRFVPLAEETGMIHAIGEWVLRTACAQVKEWLAAGYPDLRVAVNLSGRQFAEAGLVDLVRRILAEADLPARHLELEITESVLMQDQAVAVATVEALRQDGVSLAIDDFGTGYSSLVNLRNLPVSRLKIAREFIRDIDRDRRDAAIAASIITLGRSLGIEIVAEGVETAAQTEVLRTLECPLVQGYHFDHPLAREEISRRMT